MKYLSCISLFLLFGISYGVYDESIARNKMVAMSGAAYSDNPAPCISNSFSNGELYRQITISCDLFKNDKCSGFTALSHGDQAIIISFRGSQGFLQLVTEGSEAIFGPKIQSPIGGGVSEYFYKGFDQVWSAGMRDDFLTLKNKYPGYKVWVTGHSLGGSMASICASLIASQKYVDNSNIILYTFGQPRTGDTDFAHAHDALNLGASYRITHHQDLVPHLPTENFESYYHHMSEVWYNNDMTIGSSYIVCDADESNSCSDHNLIDLSINDHLHYFDRMVSDFGENGCVSSFAKFFKNIKEEDFKNVPHDMPKNSH